MTASDEAPTYVAGVDGGGTHTRILLMDASGQTLGSGVSGSGNLHDIGEERLREHVTEAWRGAHAEAGLEPGPAARAFCAMASIGTGGNRETVRRVIAEVGVAPLDQVTVDIDLVGAHAGGLGGGPGIALIAGTGSSAWGRDASGATFQSGGWGSMLDDVGSATWLGTRAMVAAIRAFDARGPKTSLEAAIADRFKLNDMRELLPRVDAEGIDRTGRAQLARIVTAAADQGDEVSIALLEEGADALAECAEAVWRSLDFGNGVSAGGDPAGAASASGDVEVVVTGGLADGAPGYRERVHAAIANRIPGATCVLPRISNVEGAARLALAARLIDPARREPVD